TVGLVLMPLAGAAMLASGIGLLKMRGWARWLTIGYACYNILSTILSVIYQVTYVVPAMDEFIAKEAQKPNLPPGQGAGLNMAGSVTAAAAFFPLLLLVYPAALLIVMYLPSIRAAFAGLPERPAEELLDDDGFDDEDEPPPEEGFRPGGDTNVR